MWQPVKRSDFKKESEKKKKMLTKFPRNNIKNSLRILIIIITEKTKEI